MNSMMEKLSKKHGLSDPMKYGAPQIINQSCMVLIIVQPSHLGFKNMVLGILGELAPTFEYKQKRGNLKMYHSNIHLILVFIQVVNNI